MKEIVSQIKGLPLHEKKRLIREIYANDVHRFFHDLVYTLDEHHKSEPNYVQRPHPCSEGTINPAVKKIPNWPYIHEMIDHLEKNDWTLVWKSRQIMATWTILAYCTWILLFHKGKKIAFQSIDGDLANELVKRVKIIYEHLPSWKPFADFSYCSIKVPENLNEGYGIKQGAEKSRSLTFSLIFNDEFGFQEKLEESFGAAKPTVDGGGKFIACTTPPRTKNFAYLCKKNPLFKVLEIHYSQRPDRDEVWKLKARKGVSQADWDREYELLITQAGVSRVIADFSERIHVNRNLSYVQEFKLLRSWDFGYHRPCVTFAQIDMNDRLIILAVILGRDEIIDHFAARVIQQTNILFPKAIIKDYCDHAGTQVSDKKGEQTSVRILQDLGVYPSYRFNKNKERAATLFRRKVTQIIGGKPGFQIHPNCEYIIDGIGSGIVYKKDGIRWEGNGLNEDGIEEKDYYIHGLDTILYLVINIYTMLGEPQSQNQKLSALKTKVGMKKDGRRIHNRF